MDKLPHRVRLLRRKAGLTLDDLAHRVGITQPYLSLLERGERQITLDLMQKISKELGCSTADLLNDDDNPERLPEPIGEMVRQLRTMPDQDVHRLHEITKVLAPAPPAEPATGTNGIK